VTTLLMHAASLWIYAQQQPVNPLNPVVYAASVLAGASVWLLLNLGRDVLGSMMRGLLSACVAALVATIIVGNYFFYTEFGEFFSASVLKFALAGNASMSLHYTVGYLDVRSTSIFAAGLIGVGLLWAKGPPLTYPEGISRRRLAQATCALLAVTLTVTCVWGPKNRLSPDGAFFSAVARAPFIPPANALRASQRLAVPAPDDPPAQRPNVVVVINESWATRNVPFYGDDTDGEADVTMPFMQRWLRQAPQRSFVFEHAYTNSTSTELSMPAALIGVGPWESADKLHTMPMAWHWAEAAGYSTFFVAAQSYDFAGYGEFFFDEDPLPHVTPDTVDAHTTDDWGPDELTISPYFGEMLEDVPDDRPFFGVYNSNALHKPFQTESRRVESMPPFDSPQKKALFIIDRAMQDIVDAVRREGRLDNTLFVFTSDHGELPNRRHLPPRVVSFYDEFTNIPFIIRVPTSWPTAHADRLENLRDNQDRMVANVDIVPTLLPVLGYSPGGAAASISGRLEGFNLLEPVPEDRTVIALNTNEVRRWEHEGFGIYWRHWRFVYSDIEGPRLFDIGRDPKQINDRWPTAPAPVRRHVFETIEETPALERIWSPEAERSR
jgi:arylsulfatase A-like enzyme